MVTFIRKSLKLTTLCLILIFLIVACSNQKNLVTIIKFDSSSVSFAFQGNLTIDNSNQIKLTISNMKYATDKLIVKNVKIQLYDKENQLLYSLNSKDNEMDYIGKTDEWQEIFDLNQFLETLKIDYVIKDKKWSESLLNQFKLKVEITKKDNSKIKEEVSFHKLK